MKTVVISLVSVVGDDIRTRTRINEIKKIMTPAGDYVLDFLGVRFISRSFADEILSFIDKSRCRIICRNVPDEIHALLEIVRANRNDHRPAHVESTVLHLRDVEQMTAFFEAI